MTSAENPVTVLSRALDQTGTVVARVRLEQAQLPTPCRSWDVRAVVNHVVHELHQFALVAGGGARESGDPGDLIGDDWADAYRAAADLLLATWRQPGALDRVRRPPVGEIPAVWTVNQQVTELVVHAWDIAKATGQSTDLDPALGRLVLDWTKENFKPEFRGDEAAGKLIGPEVAVPGDASLYDRLAAFSGRDPT
jgi:uncharacterized protein (TIGR03086 family)